MRPFQIMIPCLAILTITACSGEGDVRASAQSNNALTKEGNIDVDSVEEKPEIIFPQAVRSNDESLNDFLQHFTEVCLAGEYDNYRLLVSRQIEPVSKQQFEKTYRRVHHVEINLIRELPKISELPYPLWLVESAVHIRPPTEEPVRNLQVLIFKEDDKWVMAPAPRALREALAASSQPATQPAPQSEEPPPARASTQN
jgi:hypothetical protein